ncbi:hypothetical protein [Amycolatopsis sp. NPDC004378]
MSKVRRTIVTTAVIAAVSAVFAPAANADTIHQVPCNAPDFFRFQDRDFNQTCYAYAGVTEPGLSLVTAWSSGNNAGYFVWSDFDGGPFTRFFGKNEHGTLPDRSTYIETLNIY